MPTQRTALSNLDANLDARYGRGARFSRRQRWFAASVAVAFGVAIVAWVVWAGLLGDAATFVASDTGHVIVNDALVTVKFDLTVEPGTKMGCAVEALDESFTVVGWKLIDLPASTSRTRSFSVDVRTTEQAVTGLIYRCWLE